MSGENKKMKIETGIYFAVILQAHIPCQEGILVLLFLVNSQKNNHKLSDERQALNQGQNPLPIYMILNIKEDYSLSEFKGDGKTEVYLYSVGVQMICIVSYCMTCNPLHC